MTDAAALPAPEAGPSKGRSKGPLIGGLLAPLLGGAGFGVVYTGLFDPMALLGGGDDAGHGAASKSAGGGHGGGHGGAETSGSDFVPLTPITISLAPGHTARHLRFTAQVEAGSGSAEEVAALTPRIVDVLNTYLRAVDVKELQEPSALPRLRAQMLRRTRLVAGQDKVADLLITEFILN